ncbi:unnamed protein product [Rotaria sp. Silwood1]|nr:unnamed protein product [Rotaria sp. Silwood1]CAF4705438.1 unnamed protein product [Rotaria sp. Silwood1]
MVSHANILIHKYKSLYTFISTHLATLITRHQCRTMPSTITIKKDLRSSMSYIPDDNNPFNSLRRSNFSYEEYKNCFRYFDFQKQGFWTRGDFRRFLNALFSNKKGPHLILNEQIDEYFHETDFNQDKKIDFDEFLRAWRKPIKCAVRPVSALVIIDVQNDFISGSLALHSCPANHQGEEVVPVINQVIRTVNFDVIVYTYDWHPSNHVSFYENRHLRKISPKSRISADAAKVHDKVIFVGSSKLTDSIEQVLWPAHCIQNTHGAALHPDLIQVKNAIHLYKGTNSEIDSYSAFWDNMKLSKTSLDDQLKQRFVTDVYVVGMATDVCVASTATHAIENNYRTVLIEDACRGVSKDAIEAKQKELNKIGCIFVNSDVVAAMVAGDDRRPKIARAMFVENLKAIGRYHPR